MFKKFLAISLIVFLTFGLTACFNDKEESDKDTPSKSSKSRLVDMYNNYNEGKGIHMAYTMNYQGNEMSIDVQQKDDNIYTKSNYKGTTNISLILDDYIYTLNPSTKTGTKSKTNDSTEGTIDNNNITEEMEEYIGENKFTTGKMEVDGKKYYYEEFSNEDDTKNKMRFLFDGNTLVYSIIYTDGKEQSRLKYTVFDGNVDNSVFKVPNDYEIVEY